MSLSSRRLVLQGAVFGAVCACAAPGIAFAVEAPGAKYVCPPCGCESDGKLFDAPGACPSCGMPLITAPASEPKPANPAPPKGGEAGAEGRSPRPAEALATCRIGFLLKV